MSASSAKRWRQRNPQEFKRRYARKNLLAKYGLTPEDYERMLSEQGGVCAICQGSCASFLHLCVDHDHATGEVRGLLCSKCNRMLSCAIDEPARLIAGARYLEETARKPEEASVEQAGLPEKSSLSLEGDSNAH